MAKRGRKPKASVARAAAPNLSLRALRSRRQSAGNKTPIHFRHVSFKRDGRATNGLRKRQTYIERDGAAETLDIKDLEKADLAQSADKFIDADANSFDPARASFGTLGQTAEERRQFWLTADDLEKKNARTQYGIIAELPHEVSPAGRLKIVKIFTEAELEKRGLPYWAVTHRPDAHNDPRNFHTHILYYARPGRLTDDGWNFTTTSRPNSPAGPEPLVAGEYPWGTEKPSKRIKRMEERIAFLSDPNELAKIKANIEVAVATPASSGPPYLWGKALPNSRLGMLNAAAEEFSDPSIIAKARADLAEAKDIAEGRATRRPEDRGGPNNKSRRDYPWGQEAPGSRKRRFEDQIQKDPRNRKAPKWAAAVAEVDTFLASPEANMRTITAKEPVLTAKVDDKDWVISIKDAWCRACNEVLEEEGHQKRYHPGGYKDLGIEAEASKHLGTKAAALEAQGFMTAAGQANTERALRNMLTAGVDIDDAAAEAARQTIARREQWAEMEAEAARKAGRPDRVAHWEVEAETARQVAQAINERIEAPKPEPARIILADRLREILDLRSALPDEQPIEPTPAVAITSAPAGLAALLMSRMDPEALAEHAAGGPAPPKEKPPAKTSATPVQPLVQVRAPAEMTAMPSTFVPAAKDEPAANSSVPVAEAPAPHIAIDPAAPIMPRGKEASTPVAAEPQLAPSGPAPVVGTIPSTTPSVAQDVPSVPQPPVATETGGAAGFPAGSGTAGDTGATRGNAATAVVPAQNNTSLARGASRQETARAVEDRAKRIAERLATHDTSKAIRVRPDADNQERAAIRVSLMAKPPEALRLNGRHTRIALQTPQDPYDRASLQAGLEVITEAVTITTAAKRGPEIARKIGLDGAVRHLRAAARAVTRTADALAETLPAIRGRVAQLAKERGTPEVAIAPEGAKAYRKLRDRDPAAAKAAQDIEAAMTRLEHAWTVARTEALAHQGFTQPHRAQINQIKAATSAATAWIPPEPDNPRTVERRASNLLSSRNLPAGRQLLGSVIAGEKMFQTMNEQRLQDEQMERDIAEADAKEHSSERGSPARS
ncbi:MobA/MobL family protein [Roseomonas sp. WA12]